MRNNNIICLDTNVLIFGIQGKSTPNRQEMIPRCKAFLEWISGNKDLKVIIPAVAISEVFPQIPADQRENFGKIMEKKFIVAPFDTKAAKIHADIWIKQKGTQGISRNKIKFDHLIIATAIANNAHCIYTADNDSDLKKFVENLNIEVKDIPVIGTQSNLFN